MLMASARHQAEDLVLWQALEEADLVHGRTPGARQRAAQSLEAIRDFALAGTCYAGVSWGKDSTVLAHLVSVSGFAIPLVWIRVEPIANPDCLAVRDAFLAHFPLEYHELVEWCEPREGQWHASGTLERGAARCQARWGRRLLGLRAGESFGRAMRMRRHGLATLNACAPLGWWSLADVMGYLAVYDLPVHSAYAMLGGGRFPRERLRVCSLGGKRGAGGGRAEWEREYYGDVLARLESAART
jgi:phosphoadenosine phosphosulfate reductase